MGWLLLAPLLVVVQWVAPVAGDVALQAATLEVHGGQRCTAALETVLLQGCALGLVWGLVCVFQPLINVG